VTMDILEVIIFLQNSLIALAKTKGHALHNIAIEIDPYKKLEDSVPFILIEYNPTNLLTDTSGAPYERKNDLDVFCVVDVADKEFVVYRREAANLAKSLIETISGIEDSRVKLIPTEEEANEVMIGALKCSGVKVGYKAETNF
jgi:hypothetical protein